MKMLSVREANRAMTVVELLVVLATISILVAMIFPAVHGNHHSPPLQTKCLSQLRQIGIYAWMYTGDNQGKLPMQFSLTNGGTSEFLYSNRTFPHFEKLSGYVRDPRILLCPADKGRRSAENYVNISDTNLSYFLNADVSLTNYPTASILAGDRNLQVAGRPVHPGLFIVTTNLDVNWTRELHLAGGNLAYADGHAGFCKTNLLRTIIQRQSCVTNRLSVP